MGKENKLIIALFVLFATIACCTPLLALEDTFVPYRSYTYNYWLDSVAAPIPYVPEKIITSVELGLELNSPQDLFVGKDKLVYLLDSGNNRLLLLDGEMKVVKIIDSFINQNKEDNFNNPRGIFVNQDGDIYIADTGNKRVVVLNSEGLLKQVIGIPRSDIRGLIPENYNYNPIKVVADRAGRVYVISGKTYDGLIQFESDGQFGGFIGAPRVRPSMFDYFWKRFIATEEQREKMALTLPTEFINLDIDDRGFIYTTVAERGRDGEPIRRLNPAGKDVLLKNKSRPPVGDYGSSVQDVEGNLILPPSQFVDIAVGENGIYSALDVERGRVFTYDMYGELLSVFGHRSLQKGAVTNPVALDLYMDNRILVLDADLGQITVYKPTEYQEMIFAAVNNYHSGEYELSTTYWREVLRLNSNYDLAYIGLGEAYLLQNEYEQAMDNFRLGQDREGYSEAFALHRMEVVAENFGKIVGGLVALIIIILSGIKWGGSIKAFIKETTTNSKGISAFSRLPVAQKTTKVLESLKYGFHVIFHPFDGFWDLKREKRGNVTAAIVIIIFVCVSYVLREQYTGFIFNTRDLTKFNVLMEVASIVFPLILWCIINWALTTLMDGKGTFKDIVIFSAYALIPLILTNIPATIISNYVTLEEGPFYYAFVVIGALWAGGLIFVGTMVTHDYDFGKTMLTIIMILAGIVFVLFIGILFFSLTSQVVNFIETIYMELLYRL